MIFRCLYYDNLKTMDNYEEAYKISELIFKHLKGELSGAESEALSKWIQASEANEQLFYTLLSEEGILKGLSTFNNVKDRAQAWEEISRKRDNASSFAFIYKRYFPYAAALIMAVGLGYFFLARKPQVEAVQTASTEELLPGRDQAILVLDDGKQIDLDQATMGEIARDGYAVISKSSEGEIAYNLSTETGKQVADIKFNTISTPKGGQYKLRLPDGTRVWLNAETSIRFPTQFSSGERKVELSGEAFFDVVHIKDRVRSFKVFSGNQVIEVLGTEFNVNGYADEKNITTTLLNGKVKVNLRGEGAQSRATGEVTLAPGQRALVERTTDKIAVSQANLQESIAWKNGQFSFRDTDLQTIMRQVARWYDVEVEYKGEVKNDRFRGDISRDQPASHVFEILKASGVNIKIEGRKVIVSS